MKKNLMREVEIPQGYEAVVRGNEVSVKGNGREISRKFDSGKVQIKVSDGKIKLEAKSATRRESKIMGTVWAHINNMVRGISEGFEYKMEICNIHFPMNVKVDGDRVVIKSFLGEKSERRAKILPEVRVEVKGNEILISSHDREAAGQTAANIEKATKLTGRDRRIFQDGIFITGKPGREI